MDSCSGHGVLVILPVYNYQIFHHNDLPLTYNSFYRQGYGIHGPARIEA